MPMAKRSRPKSYYYGEEVGYWNHGDTALIVNTPKYGRKVFTGKTHMPSPSKVRWVTNVNILNNAKHHYDMVKNVDPNIEMIVTQDIEMTSDVNHADVAFACNSWMEFTYPEMTGTVSNPWVQIWKGGIRPLYDTRNDADTFAGVAAKLAEMTGDAAVPWRVPLRLHEPRRCLSAADAGCQRSTCYGYSADVMLKSEKGWMVMCRTYPRHPLWEETNESKPQWTRSGRIETYRIEPEAIEYGENFIVTPGRPGVYSVSAECDFLEQSVTFGRTITGFRSPRSTMMTSTCGTSSCRGRKSSGIRTHCGRRATSSTA